MTVETTPSPYAQPRLRPDRSSRRARLCAPAAGRSAAASLLQSAVGALLAAADLVGLLAPALVVPAAAVPLVGTAAVALVLNARAGSYRPRLRLSLLDEAPLLLGRSLAAAGLVVLALSTATDLPAGTLRAVGGALAGLLISRGIAYGLLRVARRHGYACRRTLVLGGGRLSADLVAELERHPERGLLPVAYTDDGPAPAGEGPGVPYAGRPSALDRLVMEQRATALLVAPGCCPSGRSSTPSGPRRRPGARCSWSRACSRRHP